jgi:glycosyltransferase involved in cell wall biosynthesis
MNVLVMHHGGAQIRGTEACLFKTLEALAEEGSEIFLVRNNDVVDQYVRPHCKEIINCPFPEIMIDRDVRVPVVRYLRELLSLYHKFRRCNIRCIYLSGGLPCQLGVPLSKMLGARTVCHFHHPASKRYFYLWMVNLAEAVITPSKYVSRLVKEKVNKTSVPVYVGPEPKYFPIAAEGRDKNKFLPGLGEESVVFVQLGNLAKHKRPDLLIHAFAQAFRDNKNIRLFFIGDGPMRSYLEELITSYELKGSVDLLGYVDSPAEYLQNVADVNCLASIEEGLGISVLEASACGLPSIVANCTGLAETVVDGVTGIKVEPDSIESMRDAMLVLARDKELRKEYGRAALDRVVREFSVDNYKKSIKNIVIRGKYS